MKTITKLSLIAATFAVLGSSAALAGDPQLENRLALQRQAAERDQKSTTVAVYAHRHGISQTTATTSDRSDVSLMRRDGGRGATFYFAPAK